MLLHKSFNGILYEMHSSEGYWLFSGPPDNASQNIFGTIFDFGGISLAVVPCVYNTKCTLQHEMYTGRSLQLFGLYTTVRTLSSNLPSRRFHLLERRASSRFNPPRGKEQKLVQRQHMHALPA
jgi:hypothetical protein